MTNHIMITISRECGSGGHDIAQELSEKLGIHMYDNDLIKIAARESGYTEEAFDAAEHTHTNAVSLALSMMSSTRQYNMPLNNQLYSVQSSIIRTIADKESAIIVGRCADFVLKDYAPCINVFIQSSLENRIKRVMERDGITKSEAERKIDKIDKSRATYYNFYSDSRWGDRRNYDLIINSDIGITHTVGIIRDFYNHRVPELEAKISEEAK